MSARARCQVTVALLLPLLPGRASAAPCGRADVDVAFPPDAARGVPPSAVLSAHYGAPALYQDEAVKLTDASGAEVSALTRFESASARLSATPDSPLPEGDYTIEWPGLRAVSGAGVGLGKTVRFSVRSADDDAAPVFEGLTGMAWDLTRDRDPCTDREHDRFVFRLELGKASDDTGIDLLALHVFQTRDPLAAEADAPSEVALAAWPKDGTIDVKRPTSQAGKSCFAAIAQDLAGHVSGGGQREVCVETQRPPFFDGCNLTPNVPGTGARDALWLAVFGLTLRGRGAKRKPVRAA